MGFKILSDFDGVWTDQAFEAQNVTLCLVAEAARLAGIGADEARADFARFGREIAARPERFGWAPDGRITAYVDEDPFCEANALAMFLEGARDDAPAARYAAGVREAGFADLTRFADHCFTTATNAFRDQHPPALVPHAKAMHDALVAAGAEIVIVSNSSTEKIGAWLGQVGIRASGDAGAPLRVRGSAGKMLIGPGDDSIEVGGRRIFTDRPRYAAILREERPDLVIGDVFSLDLALPHVLRRAGDPGAPRELVLRRHPHTPRWVLDTRAGGAIDHVVERVGELREFVRARAAQP